MEDINKQDEAKFGMPGIGIPAEVLFNPFLTDKETKLFGFIDNLSKSKNGCWATNKYLGWLIGCGKQNISNAIANLKMYKYIIIKETTNKDNSKQRHIYINPDYKNLYKKVVEKMHDALYKNEYMGIKELLYSDIENIIGINNIIKEHKEDIIINNNKESLQDSKSSSKKIKEEITIGTDNYSNKSQRLIKFWNNFEQTSTHKINTKTYKNLVNNLNKLQQGTFGKTKSFNDKWIKQYKIPKIYFDKVWSFQELKEAIINSSKYCLEGYWPRGDKKDFWKSLPALIYNANGKNSWLLNAIANPPKELKQITDENYKIKFPKTIEIIKKSSIWRKNYEFDDRLLDKNISKLKTFSYNIINDEKDLNNHASHFYGDLQKIVNEYLKWLSEDNQDWITKNERLFDTGDTIFKKFIEDQEKELKINIKSKGWKRK